MGNRSLFKDGAGVDGRSQPVDDFRGRFSVRDVGLGGAGTSGQHGSLAHDRSHPPLHGNPEAGVEFSQTGGFCRRV